MKILSSLIFFTLVSCANPVTKAVNKAKYRAWETVGVEKRDLFKREVNNVKEEQEETSEAFQDALTQLKEIYHVEGGNLEREQRKLSSAYDNASERAQEVHGSIQKVNKVATDLFVEWKEEIAQMKSSDLRARSSKQLSETKKRFGELHEKLLRSEKKINPVLTRLQDQVLFLKHNLNAQAIAGLKVEGARIETEISNLMKDMESSNKEAEEFIKTL